ncbi:hypothetical protein [Candidatus Marithrix sp. Canyon 246]|uniref:hypothetical protein n=1 Tax=Candidatus Marithrix sp. Canyon 246 TaxID=1827136 RepID=UPI000849F493|nr:hypothetical protein [Candidatus Marithrix sp. Canyon 246]
MYLYQINIRIFTEDYQAVQVTCGSRRKRVNKPISGQFKKAGVEAGGGFKGKKMAAHMGNVCRAIQNIEIVRVDSEKKFNYKLLICSRYLFLSEHNHFIQ